MALNARPALIQALAQRADVVQVRLDRRIELDAGTLRRVEAAEVSGFDGPSPEMLWNLQMLQVESGPDGPGAGWHRDRGGHHGQRGGLAAPYPDQPISGL